MEIFLQHHIKVVKYLDSAGKDDCELVQYMGDENQVVYTYLI
jgi:hypothetical protein